MEENFEELKNEEVEEAKKAAEAEQGAEDGALEQMRTCAEDFKRKWYSVSAEYDNYRKRNAQAAARAYADGAADTLLKLLPVADNFGYALDSAADEKTRAGIDKVIKSFKTVLASLGVEEIEISVGDEFDESVAEAVMSFPAEKGEQPNTVKQILKKGYRTGDKVIRFAQVTVVG